MAPGNIGFRRLLKRLGRRAKQILPFDVMPYIAPRRQQPRKSKDSSRPPDRDPPQSPSTDQTIFSPGEIARILSKLRTRFAYCEKPNPFPKIDLNFGNNRERLLKCRVLRSYPHEGDSAEEIRNIIEGFNSFSFKRQARPKKLELGESEGYFDRIFEGADVKGWTRQPGAWWAARKHVCFMDARGRTFSEQMEQQVEGINKAVEIWCEGRDASLNIKKRKMFNSGVRKLSFGGEVRVPIPKRQKPNRTKPARVMSEAWRARRREQEKKAGRWTDGTSRQDRSIWVAFYWVLDD